MESIKILTIDEMLKAIVDEIEPFCLKYQIEDIRAASQSIWNGFLTYVCNTLVKPNKALIYNYNLSRYKIDMIYPLCEFYITLCELYEKEVSIVGFSKLTGINTDTINEWGTNNYLYSYIDSITHETITINSAVIYKNLHNAREESLSNMLISGKRNPVGILGALNHRFGWNTQNQVLEVRQTALIERSALGISAKPTETDDIKPPSTDQ